LYVGQQRILCKLAFELGVLVGARISGEYEARCQTAIALNDGDLPAVALVDSPDKRFRFKIRVCRNRTDYVDYSMLSDDFV